MPVPLSARRRSRLLLPLLLAITLLPLAVSPAALPVERAAAAGPLDWPQWGQNPQHTGQSAATGQSPATTLADLVFDPFVVGEQQQAGGDLLAHHPVPLIRGNDVFMMQQGGTFTPCGSSTPPQSSLAARTGRALTASLTGSGAPWRPRVTPTCGSWNTKIWNMQRLSWQNGALQPVWTFASDWKPEPNGAGLAGWEPLFQSVLTADGLWVPGLGGSVHLVDPATGTGTARVMPFGGTLDPNTYVASGLAADAGGNVYYTAIALDPSDPWAAGSNPPDVRGAWLVRVKPNRSFDTVPYSVLVQNPPTSCLGTFSGGDPLPWPPSPTAQPPSAPCLSQRPAINATPAIGADGTIFVTSRAHRLAALAYGYVVAVKPDTLTPKWAASLRGHLADGCGVSLPIGGPSGCRAGTTVGVDPATNQPGAGLVIDLSSASPVALPDGGVLYGTYGDYNGARGHTFKFDTNGTFQGAYDFGWDSTPAVYQHHGTYSIVTKDNHYAVGSYCGDPTWCPVSGDGPYYITQLSANLAIEWQFKSTNTQSCHRNQDGTIACTNDHPGGFEWCINAPAVDAAGVVYVNSEDGNVYRILQGGQDGGHRFLQLAIGAAYTPLAIGPDGVLYSQNAGHLIALGQTAPAPAPAGGLKLVPPTRVLDTRAAPFGPIGTNGDGTAVQAGPVAANQTRRFRLAGQTFGTVTLPSDVTGVLVNLTIVQPAASGGFVTLFPADLAAPPNASTVNPSTAIASAFSIVALGTVGADTGSLAVFTTNQADVILDLVGYFSPTVPVALSPGNLRLIAPTRVLDTRGSPVGPIGVNGDGTPVAAAPLAAGTTRRFRLAGQTFAGVSFPADLAGALVHVTTSQGSGSGGFVTFFPGDLTTPPNASTVNPSTSLAFNGWASAIPTSGANGGTFALYSTNTLDAVVDVLGYWAASNPAAGSIYLTAPTRVLDTRPAPLGPIGQNPDGTPIAAGPTIPGASRGFRVAGGTFAAATLPTDTTGVFLRLSTVQGSGSGGFATIFPNGTAVPNASTVNPVTPIAGSFWAAPLGSGALGLYATNQLDAAIDVTAYVR